MKWWVYGTKLVCFLALLGACSTSEKAKEDRSPASIREVASYLNKKVKKKKPRVKFLKGLKNKKRFAKSTGIKLEESKGLRFFSSDSNNDGKPDTITGIRKGQVYSLKIDRNFDGKFDRFESLKKGVKTVKYDDNFDGKTDKVVTVKQVSSNKSIKTVYYTKTKKKTTYPLLVSNEDPQDSEGKFCGDCEEGFRKAVRDLRPEEARNKQQEKWDYSYEELEAFAEDKYVEPRYKKSPGYSRTYLQIEPSIWMSGSCAEEGEDLAFMISDAINDYFDCMNDWRKKGSNSNEKDLIKKRNANRLMQGLVGVASDRKRPLKIHCEDSEDQGAGWAISSERVPNQSNIPKKDAIGSIVLNLYRMKDNSNSQNKNLILHEITHLFSGAHGDGQDNFTTCPALCLGASAIDREGQPLTKKEWQNVLPSFENICLADREVHKNGSSNLDLEPYSYLNNIFKVYKTNLGNAYKNTELGMQIANEIVDRKGTVSIPIQKLSKKRREELVLNYLIVAPDWNEKRALKFIKEFKPGNEYDISNENMILPSLILDNRPITIERINLLKEASQDINADGYIPSVLRQILRSL